MICWPLQVFQNGQTARTRIAKFTDQVICSPDGTSVTKLGGPLPGAHQGLNLTENKRFMEDQTSCSATFAGPNRRLGPQRLKIRK